MNLFFTPEYAKTGSDGTHRYVYGWNPTRGENIWKFDSQHDYGGKGKHLGFFVSEGCLEVTGTVIETQQK